MGCDIHECVERKRKYTYWQNCGSLDIERWYQLFSKLAAVRMPKDSEIRPIAYPKGLPEDCNLIFQTYANQWIPDGHSHSWLTLKELKIDNHPFLQEIIQQMEKIKIVWSITSDEDIRLVFFFDN